MDPYGILLLMMMAAMGTSLGLKTSRSYKITKTTSSCTSQELKINLEMNRAFRGVVYAKGFPLEKSCRSYGINESSVEISLSTSGCGIRLTPINDDKLSYSVTLTVQMDRFLQQINDLEVTSSCDLTPNDMTSPKLSTPAKQTRTGRNQGGASGSLKEETLRKIKTWMEIEGTSDSSYINKVSVGEQTMVLVKTYLPEGLAASVVDCYAHDGTGDVTQRLVDEKGCPLDETIMPSLEIIRDEEEEEGHSNEITWDQGEERSTKEQVNRTTNPKNIQLVPETALQIIGTMFSAFKFPDTAILHLKCTLQICREFCPQVSCTKEDDLETAQNRAAKSLKRRKEAGDVIDKIEVFNSVEVIAPGIDTDGFPNEGDERSDFGEKTFCLSVSKMAFSFAILGAIFLCAVLAALWTIMRNRGRKMHHSFDGSEQILVVRDSPLNFPRNKPNSWTYS